MSTLAVHGPDADLEEILCPASPDGDEFTAPPGSTVVYVVNRLKRRRRGIGLHIERSGGSDDMSMALRPQDTIMLGPFGMRFGADGFFIPDGEPVTVQITYPDASGLQVCAVRLPEVGDVMTYSSPGIGIGLQPRE